jgi:DNA-binding NtrC family response regulator
MGTTQTGILIICRDTDIMETILRLLNQMPEWKSFGATTNDEAIEIFSAHPIDIVLIGSGVDEHSEKQLEKEFKKRKPAVKIVQHFGGGSGLLFSEVQQALHKGDNT